jgi:oligopeptidase B
LGGFNKDDYVSERLWARSSDGTMVPISLVYRKDMYKRDGNANLLLYG